MERKRLVAVGACALLLLASCGGGGASDSGSGHVHEPGTEDHEHGVALGEPGDPAQADETIDVVASDGPFRFEPEAVAVAAGETIVFELVNEGEVEHEFTLVEEPTREATGGHEHGDADPNATPRVAPGDTAQVAWTFTEPGRFFYECHVDGHHLAGMRGTITVRG